MKDLKDTHTTWWRLEIIDPAGKLHETDPIETAQKAWIAYEKALSWGIEEVRSIRYTETEFGVFCDIDHSTWHDDEKMLVGGKRQLNGSYFEHYEECKNAYIEYLYLKPGNANREYEALAEEKQKLWEQWFANEQSFRANDDWRKSLVIDDYFKRSTHIARRIFWIEQKMEECKRSLKKED